MNGRGSSGPGPFDAVGPGETRKARLMATLDRWRSYLTVPKTLVFPRLELIGRDHSPAISNVLQVCH